MRGLTEAGWDDVRRAFEFTAEPVATIAKRHGVSPTAIRSRAKQQNWQRCTMAVRLYDYLDGKLAQLEARMDNDVELSVADQERQARTLGHLIRSFDQVNSLIDELQIAERCCLQAREV